MFSAGKGKKKRTEILSKLPFFYGAGGGARTHTPLPAKDFESSSSTIPTHRQMRALYTAERQKAREKNQMRTSIFVADMV